MMGQESYKKLVYCYNIIFCEKKFLLWPHLTLVLDMDAAKHLFYSIHTNHIQNLNYMLFFILLCMHPTHDARTAKVKDMH